MRSLQTKLRTAKFFAGAVDGVFGPETARGVRTGKYWLGYDQKMIEAPGGAKWGETANNLLDKLLAGKPLPSPYGQRRAARVAQAKKEAASGTTLREKTLANAQKHVYPAADARENPPGSNQVPWASGWYGIVGPWCAMAVTRWAVDAGSHSFVRGRIASYVPNIVHFATTGAFGFRRTYAPLPGHGVCYDWTGDGVWDHVGLVKTPPKSLAPGTEFRTIEGNTSSDNGGSQSNGGGCFERERVYLGPTRAFFFSYS